MAQAPKALVVPAVAFLAGLLIGLFVQVRPVDAVRPPKHEEASARTFLLAQEPRYRDAVARAKAWLDTIDLDPKRERELGLGPYKKLAELVYPYVRLSQRGAPADAAAMKQRIATAVAPSLAGQYLDLATASDAEFSRDSMSYLRIGYLMERVGLDARRYRDGVAALGPRLNADFGHRGVWQQQAMTWYYGYFGLALPVEPGHAGGAGMIAQRADPYQLTRDDNYALMHEVLVPYHYGELREAHPFDAGDKAYLQGALTKLATRWIMDQNPDLTAEILSCMTYVGLEDTPEFRDAVSFLLRAQHPDGSWGTPPSPSPGLGAIEKEIYYLHTTEVALVALLDVFALPR